MKIIRDNVCYIEKEDIKFIRFLPERVSKLIDWDYSYSSEFELLCFKDSYSIQYFLNEDFILNYEEVKDLSIEELNRKKYELEDKIESISSSDYLEGEESLNKDAITTLKYYIASIRKYIENKDLYDKEIEKLSFVNLKKVELQYFSVVGEFEPVRKIPISASELAKIDQSIRSKVDDNAKRLVRGLDKALNYRVGLKRD